MNLATCHPKITQNTLKKNSIPLEISGIKTKIDPNVNPIIL